MIEAQGIITRLVMEMTGEAHEGEEPAAGTHLLVGGFVLLVLIATYLG